MFTMMFALDMVSVCRQLAVTRVNGYQGGACCTHMCVSVSV